MHSILLQQYTSMLRAWWTLPRISHLLVTHGLHLITGTATSAYGSCKSLAVRPRRHVARLRLPRHCTYQPHPCTVLTAAHHIHSRPPDLPARLAYQRLLVNTYCTFDLCRPRGRPCPTSVSCDHRSFSLTRSGDGIDLPGFGRGHTNMSDQEDARLPKPSTPPDTRRPRMIHTMGFICDLSIEDVLKSVLLDTLKDSPTRKLRRCTSPRCSGTSNCLRWSHSCTRGRSRRTTPLAPN
jgi:hypothetical protein